MRNRLRIAHGHLGTAQTKLEEFKKAEVVLLDAHEVVTSNQPAVSTRTVTCCHYLVELYQSWHAAEPGKGYDARAAEWRAKLPQQETGGG